MIMGDSMKRMHIFVIGGWSMLSAGCSEASLVHGPPPPFAEPSLPIEVIGEVRGHGGLFAEGWDTRVPPIWASTVDQLLAEVTEPLPEGYGAEGGGAHAQDVLARLHAWTFDEGAERAVLFLGNGETWTFGEARRVIHARPSEDGETVDLWFCRLRATGLQTDDGRSSAYAYAIQTDATGIGEMHEMEPCVEQYP